VTDRSEGNADAGSETRSDVAAPPRKRWLLGIALVVAVYTIGFGSVDLGDALDALRAGRWPFLVAAAGLEAITVASLAMVHRSSARAVGVDIRYLEALNVSMSFFTVSQTLPGGGAVAGALGVRRLQRFGLDGPSATASVALTATLAMSTITAIAAGGIAVSVLRAGLPARVLALVLALLFVLLGAAFGIVAVLRSASLQRRLMDRLGRIHEKLRERVQGWSESLEGVRHDPPEAAGLGRIVGWSAVNWSVDIAALWLVFQAVDATVTLPILLVGFAVSQVGAAIPITPGGVGFVETGMIGAFVVFGTPASVATTIVLAYRVLAIWLPALAGVPALLRPPPAREPADAHGR
jgi:uncharacterized protein (TIRG00374 family)